MKQHPYLIGHVKVKMERKFRPSEILYGCFLDLGLIVFKSRITGMNKIFHV